MHQLPSIDQDDRNNMVSRILNASSGCFLWVSLTLQELKQVHTSAEIREVLDNVPSDMNQLYSRILSSMSRAPYGKKLAHAILTWTVCAARPLSTDELHHALEIDLKDRVDDVERSISSSCGQLVHVDTHSRVQMVHMTARDFLMQSDSMSEFAVNKKQGHKRLMMACLEYLNGNQMRSSRHRKLSARHVPLQRCSFVKYASNFCFDHLYNVESTDDEVMASLFKFLSSSNVLSWIEYIASHSDLHRLIYAGRALKNLLQRRSKHLLPFGKEVTVLDSWSIDMVRLVTKFGRQMLLYPASVFHLIPPFCPFNSAPRKQFAASSRSLTVLGISNHSWDDCMSTIINPEERCSALACCNGYFAIGMFSGNINIYNELSCQHLAHLRHPEAVKLLQFSTDLSTLVSAGMKKICLWECNAWVEMRTFDITSQCMSVGFVEEQELFLAALKNNCLVVWELDSGVERDSVDWTTTLEGRHAHQYRRPIAVALCVETYILGVIYRGQDVLLWDMERDALLDTYSKETGAFSSGSKKASQAGALCLIFSQAPNLGLLAVSYSDGDLVLFDTVEGEVKASTIAYAQTLACSPDGRTLACASTTGTIQIFDFETLKLMYRINSEDYVIKALAFSADGQRLLDISSSKCRVWDPTILIRQSLEEDGSDTVSVSTHVREVDVESPEESMLITSLACHQKLSVAFCGKEDGSVSTYSTVTGCQTQLLFTHAVGVSVLSLVFDSYNNTLISRDSSSPILIHVLNRNAQDIWNVSTPLLDHRTAAAIEQVLINPDASRVLVSTATSNTLWSLKEHNQPKVQAEHSPLNPSNSQWTSHPLKSDVLILISNTVAYLHNWADLSPTSGSSEITLEGEALPQLSIRSALPCLENKAIATLYSDGVMKSAESKLIFWDPMEFLPGSQYAAPIPRYRALADEIMTLIGETGQRLVFLHGSGWICSIDSQNPTPANFQYHFFLPADWLTARVDALFGVNGQRDVLVVRKHELAVIKNGMSSSEPAPGLASRTPSLLGTQRPSLSVPEG